MILLSTTRRNLASLAVCLFVLLSFTSLSPNQHHLVPTTTTPTTTISSIVILDDNDGGGDGASTTTTSTTTTTTTTSTNNYDDDDDDFERELVLNRRNFVDHTANDDDDDDGYYYVLDDDDDDDDSGNGIIKNDDDYDDDLDDDDELDNNKQQQQKQPPNYFVFHVGPHKTATTMIQLQSKYRQDSTLLQDNYHYIGKGSHNAPSPLLLAIRDMKCRKEVSIALSGSFTNTTTSSSTVSMSSSTRRRMPDCWNNMRIGFQELNGNDDNNNNNTRSRNIFLSTEDTRIYTASKEWWIALKDIAMREFNYHMIVIVAYRRLYDWIPSAHSQLSRGGISNKYWNNWHRDGGHIVIPIYPRVMQNEYINPTNSTPTWFRWTSTYLETIPSDIIETRVLNIHNERNTLTNFFCDIMPNTLITCQDCIDYENDSSRIFVHSNPSSPYWYDQLIIAAEWSNLINISIHERRHVWKDAWKYHREQLNHSSDIEGFQWICPTHEELNIILNASLYWERYIIYGNNTTTTEQQRQQQQEEELEHRTQFWDSVYRKKKFCNLDTDATLQQDEWKTFFQNYS